MPKNNLKIKKWLRLINCEHLVIQDSDQIFCKLCKCVVSNKQKFLVQQHLKTKTHRNLATEFAKEQDEKENEVEEDISNTEFNYDLCRAMVAANMSWKSLNNNVFKSFLCKYTNKSIPDESTVRKNYLIKAYLDVIGKIRNEIGDSYIWISVDETTDKTGKHIANFIAGKLSSEIPTEPYLVCCKELSQVNFATVARFVSASLSTLWPDGKNNEKVLLFVTDAASYMVKAAESLKIFYPNLKHLTCLVHAIHRIAEEIRDSFPVADSFISVTKKVFLKSPSRIAKYKQITNNAPLPPIPVITRWGTWVKAAVFHAEHFFKIKEVLESFNSKDAKSIQQAQNIVKEDNVFDELIAINNNFMTLPETITKMESKGMHLVDSMNIFLKFIKEMRNIEGQIGQIINKKMNFILNKNPTFQDLRQMTSVLSGFQDRNYEISIEKKFWPYFKFAPISSVDVERSFSMYKNVLQDNRERYTTENLEQVIVVYCNKQLIDIA